MKARLEWLITMKMWRLSYGEKRIVFHDEALKRQLEEYRHLTEAENLKGIRQKISYLRRELKRKYVWKDGEGLVPVE